MEKFTQLEATAAPIMRQNINTDVIIRVERLRDFPKGELGPYAFESWRYDLEGKENPDFILNREPYRDAEIILAADNFACGSSREMAVWALQDFGIRCVIAPSFGQIFFNNCFQNGMLPVVLPLEDIEAMVAEVEQSQGTAKIKVDLEKQLVTTPSGKEIPFSLDNIRREGLLQGLDHIEQTMQHDAEIAAFQAKDRERFPWIYGRAS
jgi:3-isopropylmalate/(R)-2-methylmalate dehydratase small subunit